MPAALAGGGSTVSIPAVFVALLAVLIATLLCGMLSRRLGQPRVVGEMLAGILLGPSLFGWLAPGVFEAVFPTEVRTAIHLLSQLGLVLFMFLVGAGLRSENRDRVVVRGAATVGIAGVVIPFALGFGAAWLVSDVLAPQGTATLQVALLLSAALSVTAFPVLARMIAERDMEGTLLGSTTLLAASVDDAAAWILLAVTAAVAGRASGADVVLAMVGGAVFVAVMLVGVRRALTPVARWAERRGEVGVAVITALLVLVVASATVTELLGLHVAFGAFVAGVALPDSTLLRDRVRIGLTDINVGLLLPLFFVYTGLQTELQSLTDPRVLGPVVLILVVAFAGKYLGCTLTLRAQGHPLRRASAIGGLMNARGLMVLIFAQVASDLGIISSDLFTILVLIGLITTAAAMPIYRLSLPRRLEDAERAAVPPVAGAPGGNDAPQAQGSTRSTADPGRPATVR